MIKENKSIPQGNTNIPHGNNSIPSENNRIPYRNPDILQENNRIPYRNPDVVHISNGVEQVGRKPNRDIIVGGYSEPIQQPVRVKTRPISQPYMQPYMQPQVQQAEKPKRGNIRKVKQSKAAYKAKALLSYGCMGAYAGVLGFSSAVRNVLLTFAGGVFMIANNNAPETMSEGFHLFLYGLASFLLILPLGALLSFAISYTRLSKGDTGTNTIQKRRRRY